MIQWRFWRRLRIAPHTMLNISKGGMSLSFVSRLLNVTFGRHGVRFSSGLRGTGLSIFKYLKFKK